MITLINTRENYLKPSIDTFTEEKAINTTQLTTHKETL